MNDTILNLIKGYVGKESELLLLSTNVTGDVNKLNTICNLTFNNYGTKIDSPDVKTITMDPKQILLNDKYDVIYSNKLLDEFNEHEFTNSIRTQCNYLNKDGVLIHSLTISGIDKPYTIPRIREILKSIVIEEFYFYEDKKENDSMVIVLRR